MPSSLPLGPLGAISQRSVPIFHTNGHFWVGWPGSGSQGTRTARVLFFGRATSLFSQFPKSRQPDTSGHIRASRACHHRSTHQTGPNHVWDGRGRDLRSDTRRRPPASAPPPTSGRTAVTCSDSPSRRDSSRVQCPVFPSAGSGATFLFRLRVPKRRGRPDGAAERRRGR